MYYMYDMNSVPHKPDDEYYELNDLKDLILIEYDPDDENFDPEQFDKDHNGFFWPVHDINTRSDIPSKCADLDEAKAKVLISLNNDIYERLMGI